STRPWIITRNLADRPADSSATLRQSNADGYQPTANDRDIWGSLTPQQRNQQIGPGIAFYGSPSRVDISRIYGRFITIYINGGRYCRVRHCEFRGGKSVFGAVQFDNANNNVPQGLGNDASDNVISYASYNAIAFFGNDDFTCCGNTGVLCGESGVSL